jgi:hypothetical protein
VAALLLTFRDYSQRANSQNYSGGGDGDFNEDDVSDNESG